MDSFEDLFDADDIGLDIEGHNIETIDQQSSVEDARSLEKHLDSPILTSVVRRILSCVDLLADKYFPDTRSYVEALDRHRSDDPNYYYSGLYRIMKEIITKGKVQSELKELTPHQYPSLFKIGVNDIHDTTIQEITQLSDTAVSRGREAYISWMSDVLSKSEVDNLRRRLLISQPDSQLIDAYGRYSFWNRVVELFRRDYSRQFFGYIHDLSYFKMQVFDRVALLTFEGALDDRATCYVVTYEQLQLIQDVCHSRLNTEWALVLGFHNGTAKLRDLVHAQLDWQDRCIQLHGNAGYELVKAPEALCKTYLTTLTSGDILAYSSFNRTRDKIKEKELLLARSSRLIEEYVTLLQTITNIHDVAELFGITKMAGHPTVIASVSAEAVKKRALTPSTAHPWSIHQQVRIFKHLVLSGYILQHGDWPPMIRQPRPGTELHRLWMARSTSLTLADYKLSELDPIRFDQFLQFDYSVDFAKFLDDKAIGVGAAEAHTFWYGNQERTHSRRLLLELLNTEEFNLKQIVERMRHGRFYRDELIVELTQKERELKPAARCFCKLPLAVRTFFTLTEYNLSEQFMKHYMPQQSMTMSDASIKKRLYRMAFGTQKQGTAVLEIDFSTWNTMMRQTPVNAIAKQLEDIYGLQGVFSQAHSFFSASTIVLTDKHACPEGVLPGMHASEWPTSDLVWRNHLGGFEGIQQKLWTIFTITLIYHALLDSGTNFILTGQGDNQVLLLTGKSDAYMKEILPKLLSDLEFYSLSVGQVVKPDECIDSKTVLTYSKELYVRGVHVQYSLKFLSRTFRRDDSDIPSLSAEISGVVGASMAAAGTLPIPMCGFIWQHLHLVFLLTTHRQWSTRKTMRDQLTYMLANPLSLDFALNLPASLGGFPVATWGRYLIKGEVDPLTWDIASTLRTSSKSLLKHVDLLLSRDGISTKPDPTQLLIDPYSIPIIRPRDQTRLIKEFLRDSLPGMTKNKWIAEILSNDTTNAGVLLSTILATTRPLYPTIMSDIYAMSLAGVQDSIYGRFMMTRTVRELSGTSRFVRIIEDQSEALLIRVGEWFTRTLSYRSNPSLDVAKTSEYADRLRSFWFDTRRQTPSSEHPITITTICPLSMELTTDITGEEVISGFCRTPLEDVINTVGPYPPNFGTKTRQKISDFGFKILHASSTLQDIKSLTTTINQVSQDPLLRGVIDDIIQSRCPWTLKTCSTVFPEVYGGVAAHRHDSLSNKFFGILGNSTIPTHINFSSDRSGPLSGGVYDYANVFQEDYLTVNAAIQCKVHLKSCSSSCAVGLRVSSIPLTPLSTQAVECTTVRMKPTWKRSPNNPLLFVDRMELQHLPELPTRREAPLVRAKMLSGIAIYVATLYGRWLTSLALVDTDNSPHVSSLRVIEHLDIAEFNQLPSNGLVLAISRVAKYLMLSGIKRSLIDKLILVETGSLARLFLTPQGQQSSLVMSDGVSARMGERYALTPHRRLNNRVQLLMSKLDPIETIVSLRPIIISADTNRAGTLLVYTAARTYLRYLRKLYPTLHSLHKGIQSLSYIRNYSEITNSVRVSFLVRVVSECFDTVANTNVHSRDDRAVAQLRRAWPPFRLYPRDQIELQRLIRGVPKPPDECQPIRIRPTRNFATPARLLKKTSNVFLRTAPDFLEHHQRRRDGIVSTALSTWAPIICRESLQSLQDSTWLIVGIGHGAACVPLLASGATVVGLDLLSSLPKIPQRETSLTPVECTLHGYSAGFRWSSAVWTHGGDWYACERNTVITQSKITHCIVDIETGMHGHGLASLYSVLTGIGSNFLKKILVRCFLSVKECVWLISHKQTVLTPGCNELILLPAEVIPVVIEINGHTIEQLVDGIAAASDVASLPEDWSFLTSRWPDGPHMDYRGELRSLRLNYLCLDVGLDPPELTESGIQCFLRDHRSVLINSELLRLSLDWYLKIHYHRYPPRRAHSAKPMSKHEIRAMCYLFPF